MCPFHGRGDERAETYDLAQAEKYAALVRKMATTTPFASKAYRILQLNYLTRILKGFFEPDTQVPDDRIEIYLALMTRYQSVMQQIAREMEGIDGVTLETCDAAALKAISEEIANSSKQQK